MATVRNLKTFTVEISVDGKKRTDRIVGLFVMNMPYGGGGMKFTPPMRTTTEANLTF